jgi:ATP-binding cassette, subfamily C, bacterial exporter for protease/lipase
LRTGSPAAGQALSDLTRLRQFATGNALFAFFDAPWFPVYLFVIFMFSPWLGLLALGGAVVLMLSGVGQPAGFARPRSRPPASGRWRPRSRPAPTCATAEAIEAMGMLDTLRGRWLAQHIGLFGAAEPGQRKNRHRQRLVQGRAPGPAIAGAGARGLAGGAGADHGGDDDCWVDPDGARAEPDRSVDWRVEAVVVQRGWRISAWRRCCTAYPAAGASDGFARAHGASWRWSNWAPVRTGHPARHVGQPEFRVAGRAGAGGDRAVRLRQVDPGPAAGRGLAAAGTGKVRLDGADLSQWDKHQLGPHLGYLPQDIQLFAGTIAHNIARFAEVNADKVLAAAQMAGVHELILQLPQGYDTVLGDSGAGLSGGQKQRIGLARAVYGLPAVIVLDEPNSNLDDAGEQALLQAITRLKTLKRTLILITHKPNVLTLTDQLLILRDGQLQAFGPTASVLAAPASGQARPAKPAMNVSYRLGVVEAGKA